MAPRSNKPRRDSAGRFVKRRDRSVSAAPSAESSTTDETRTSGPGVGKLTVLTIAIILGAIGFVLPLVWIGSLILMAVLWGVLATERQHHANVGVLAEVVSVVVDEVKDVRETATKHHDDRSIEQ